MMPYCIMMIEDDDDRAFMEALYENYHRLMYHEIIKIVHDPWATEDLMQTTLVKLIEKVKELRQKNRNQLVNYIISACKNRAFNYLRDYAKKRGDTSLEEEWELPDFSKDGKRVEEQILRDCEMEEFSNIWALLDERSRFVLESRYILDMTPQEIAKDLNIKPESVRMALTRARKNACKLMKEHSLEPNGV